MEPVQATLLVLAAVLALNLLPAFGPPTWAVLVLFSLHLELPAAVLIATGAIAAATGRLVLALGTRRLARYVPEKQRLNLQAAGELIEGRRAGSIAFLALFALSPLPSAQLFEAAGLVSVRLVPLTAAFFAGRLVSYSVYIGGASALRSTNAGQVLLSGITSPWALLLEVGMLFGLVILARIDWTRHLRPARDEHHAP